MTREEEKVEKLEWSGNRGVGMVEPEEKAGPREREQKPKTKSDV